MERNLGKEFSEKKICVKVSSVNDIDMLQKFINEYLFEDTSILKSKSYHRVYEAWFSKGHHLAIGKINEQVEVISVVRFLDDGFEVVSVEEFIDNVMRF